MGSNDNTLTLGTDPGDDLEETVIGDLAQSDEYPLFEQDQAEALSVVVNVSYARHEQGEHAIRVLDTTGQPVSQLTAAQAHQLAVDLHDAANIVGEIRQKAGFTS